MIVFAGHYVPCGPNDLRAGLRHESVIRLLRRVVRRGWPRWGGVMVVRYPTSSGFTYQASVGNSGVQSLSEIAYRDVLVTMSFNRSGTLLNLIQHPTAQYRRTPMPKWEQEKLMERLNRTSDLFDDLESANVIIDSTRASYLAWVRYANRNDGALLVRFDRTSPRHTLNGSH